MKFQDLTAEQKEQIAKCTTLEEIMALAQAEGIELEDQELEQIAGGDWRGHQCPKCGSYDVEMTTTGPICDKCGYGTFK